MRLIISMLLFIFCASSIGAEPIQNPVRLTQLQEVISRLDACKSATLSAYTLASGSTIVNALERAADRGCRVNVVLDGRAFGVARTRNEAVIPELQSHRIRAIVSSHPLHLKLAIFDGAFAYMSDRNWASSGDSLVYEDRDRGDFSMLYRALVCSYDLRDEIQQQCPPKGNNHLWVVKGDALQAEAAVILSNKARDISVESESWGGNTPVFNAVAQMAQRGIHVRVLVADLEYRQRKSTSERRALAELIQLGVAVRVGPASEKIAINGPCAFAGSANNTHGLADQIDFGLAYCGTTFSRTLAEHFETNWAAASDVR